MATLAGIITDSSDLANPNVVKVVVDRKGDALYFSRSPIPFPFDAVMRVQREGNGGGQAKPFLRHVGLYAFRKPFLEKVVRFPLGELEKLERLEQLRVLENGYNIRVVETSGFSMGVDTLEDVKKVEAWLLGKEK